MSRLLRRRRPSEAQNQPTPSSSLPQSASSSSMASSSSGSSGLGLPSVELSIPKDDFRGSVIITNLAKRFSILREAHPTQTTHLPLSAPGRPPVSIEDIRLRLAEQRRRAARERGEQEGKRWFVTEEEEDIVLEELVLPQEEVSKSSPVADFRRSPSDWTIARSTTPTSTSGSLARSQSASATSTASLSSIAHDPRLSRPAGGSSKSYGISSGSQMRDKEIMRMAAARGGKMKKSGSDRTLDVVAEGRAEGQLVAVQGDDDVTSKSSEIVDKWTPPVSAASHVFARTGSSFAPPPPAASRRGPRRSLLDGLSPASLKRISMALVEIEEELTATREIEDVHTEVLEDVMTGSPEVKPLTPHRGKMLSSSSSGSIGPAPSGHERKTSITRSPAYHDSLSIVAHSAPLVDDRPPSPSPAPTVTRANSDRAPNLSRKSSRAGRHNRQPSATSQLNALLPELPRSAPISHGRSACSSPVYPGVVVAPLRPVTLRRERSSSTTSAGASPVSRDSIINGYVPGAARPFTPPRSATTMEGEGSASPSRVGAVAATTTSPCNASRIATARAGGENRPQLSIKPGLTVPMVRSASGGGIPSVSPVVETFEANEETPTDGASSLSHHTFTSLHVPGHLRTRSAGSSPLATHGSIGSPRDEDGDAGDFTFDATAYYGQPSPVRKNSLVEGLEVLDTESRQLGETSRHSSRTSLDSDYDLEECDDHLESILFPTTTTSAVNGVVAYHDGADDAWDITHEQLMTIQNKLVDQAKAIRLAMSGPDELSPRPSPNPAGTLQQRPSTRLRRTEISTFAMREEVGQLEVALSPPMSAVDGHTPSLQRQPTTSSTMSSNFARTPSSANDHATPRDDPTITGRFSDGMANDSADDSFSRDAQVPVEHQTPLREAKVPPYAPDSLSPRSRDLANDPAIRKHFEEKIAQATAELHRNASTSKVSRKNTRTKASHISSPQLLSSSSKIVTNPISSPRMEPSSQVESPRDASSAAGRFRKLAGLATSKDVPDSPLASRSDTSTLSAPIRLKPVSSVRRADSKKVAKESSTSNPQASSLHRGASTGFRGLIGKLRTKGVAEPLFEEVSPLVEGFDGQSLSPPIQEIARTERRTAQTNSVVRRTIIMPHQNPPPSIAKPEVSLSTPYRKPSTRRKPVKPLDDTLANPNEMELLKSPLPQADTDDDPQSLHTRTTSSQYSQPASDGSILDMYMEQESEGDSSFHEGQVRDAVEICEMSDGNVIWNVLERGKTVESHEIAAAKRTLARPAEVSSAFQLSIKGPSSNKPVNVGQARPETKVYFSSSAQMADLIEDISRDLDSGRFDVVPSHEAVTATPTTSGPPPPPPPISARLQSLLAQHLGAGLAA